MEKQLKHAGPAGGRSTRESDSTAPGHVDLTAACSEMVVFPDVDRSATLPTSEAVAIELLWEKPGAYGFACQMGMLRGKLIVE